MTASNSLVGTTGRARRAPVWRVRPHGTLEAIAENAWWTWGLPAAGPRPRSMVLARRSDGDLVVQDALSLDEREMRALEAIGRPRYLVVSDVATRLDARAFVERYPDLQVFVPRRARDAMAKLVRVDGILEDFPADEAVQVRSFRGIGDARGALLVRSADGLTLAVGDLLASLDRRRPLALLRAALLRQDDVFLVRNRHALRDDLLRHAARPELARLVEGGRVVGRAQAARVLEAAAARL